MQLLKPEKQHEKFYTCQPRGLSHFRHTQSAIIRRDLYSFAPLIALYCNNYYFFIIIVEHLRCSLFISPFCFIPQNHAEGMKNKY